MDRLTTFEEGTGTEERSRHGGAGGRVQDLSVENLVGGEVPYELDALAADRPAIETGPGGIDPESRGHPSCWCRGRTRRGCGPYRETIEGFLSTDAVRDSVHATLDLFVFLRTVPDHPAIERAGREIVPRLEAEATVHAAPELAAVVRILASATRDVESVSLGSLVEAGRRLSGYFAKEPEEATE